MPNEKTIKIEDVSTGLLGKIVGRVTGYNPDHKATITETDGTVRTGFGNTEEEAIEDAKKH